MSADVLRFNEEKGREKTSLLSVRAALDNHQNSPQHNTKIFIYNNRGLVR